MGYQGGRRYGGQDRDRFSSDWDRGNGGNDRYRASPESYRYGTRGQYGGPSADRYDNDRYERARYDGNRHDAGRYDNRRPPSDYDPDDRGFFDRAGDEIRSWFGDEEAERRREYDDYYNHDDDGRDEGRYASHAYAGSGSGTGYGMARGGGFWSGGYARDRARYADAGSTAARAYGPQYGGQRDSSGQRSGQRDHGAHDHNYQSWRQDRIAELDRDYADYQRENRDRFHQEFTGWRTRRGEQRQALVQVREHMEVVGSDGEHVGTVDKLRGDRIILTKNDADAGGVHHSIPSAWIKAVDAQKVTLEKTADQAQTIWRTERDQQAMFGSQDHYGAYRADRADRDVPETPTTGGTSRQR